MYTSFLGVLLLPIKLLSVLCKLVTFPNNISTVIPDMQVHRSHIFFFKEKGFNKMYFPCQITYNFQDNVQFPSHNIQVTLIYIYIKNRKIKIHLNYTL